MSNLEIGLASFPALLILIFIRVPIGLAMFLVGLVDLLVVSLVISLVVLVGYLDVRVRMFLLAFVA